MPRSQKRSEASQRAYRKAEKERKEDIERRREAAAAKAKASKPKKVQHTRSRWTTDY